jgi:hypothetical protein
VGASFCGNYNFGGNFFNESSISYGPGLAFSRTIGGDDVIIGGQQNITEYDGATTTVSGDTITISNINQAVTSGQSFTYQIQVIPVPAAAWLFGSALGLLGWARRRAAK